LCFANAQPSYEIHALVRDDSLTHVTMATLVDDPTIRPGNRIFRRRQGAVDCGALPQNHAHVVVGATAGGQVLTYR
jgi:hypothetical protein